MNPVDDTADPLRQVLEIEEFLHALLGATAQRRLKPGEDITRLVGELGLRLPASFAGAPITWMGIEDRSGEAESKAGQTLVLVRPGKPDALGLTIGCVKIRGRRYCLECGFWYCRIVIKF